MTLDDLSRLLGTCLLDLSPSYYGDHVFESETGYEIQVGKDDRFTASEFEQFNLVVEMPLLVRVRLQSRHSRSKNYQAYPLCDLPKDHISSVVGYYCQRIQGARTVSPCAHVASVIWFLGYGRSLDHISTRSEFLNQHFPAGLPIAESDDEDVGRS